MPSPNRKERRQLSRRPQSAISQALLYGENNQSDQATQHFEPMLDHSPNDLEIYLDLAQVDQQGQHSRTPSRPFTAPRSSRPAAEREMVGFLMGGFTSTRKSTIRPSRPSRACWRSTRGTPRR